jgi:hypothetical protein
LTGRHHTMIGKAATRSTRHADEHVTSYGGVWD